eukprot:668490-Rhodomonas_salina.6
MLPGRGTDSFRPECSCACWRAREDGRYGLPSSRLCRGLLSEVLTPSREGQVGSVRRRLPLAGSRCVLSAVAARCHSSPHSPELTLDPAPSHTRCAVSRSMISCWARGESSTVPSGLEKDAVQEVFRKEHDLPKVTCNHPSLSTHFLALHLHFPALSFVLRTHSLSRTHSGSPSMHKRAWSSVSGWSVAVLVLRGRRGGVRRSRCSSCSTKTLRTTTLGGALLFPASLHPPARSSSLTHFLSLAFAPQGAELDVPCCCMKSSGVVCRLLLSLSLGVCVHSNRAHGQNRSHIR